MRKKDRIWKKITISPYKKWGKKSGFLLIKNGDRMGTKNVIGTSLMAIFLPLMTCKKKMQKIFPPPLQLQHSISSGQWTCHKYGFMKTHLMRVNTFQLYLFLFKLNNKKSKCHVINSNCNYTLNPFSIFLKVWR